VVAGEGTSNWLGKEARVQQTKAGFFKVNRRTTINHLIVVQYCIACSLSSHRKVTTINTLKVCFDVVPFLLEQTEQKKNANSSQV